MYILTYKNKPVTWKQMYKILDRGYQADGNDENMFLVGRTKRAVLVNFIYVAGFKWREWQKDGWDIINVFYLSWKNTTGKRPTIK